MNKMRPRTPSSVNHIQKLWPDLTETIIQSWWQHAHEAEHLQVSHTVAVGKRRLSVKSLSVFLAIQHQVQTKNE